MEINGLNLNAGGFQQVENTRTAKVETTKTRKGDSVDLSRSAKTRESEMAVRESMPIDFAPRIEKLRSIEQLMADGAYDTQEFLDQIAEGLVESQALKDTVADVTGSIDQTADIRTDAVALANEQASASYYDNQDVLEMIAGRLISETDLLSLL